MRIAGIPAGGSAVVARIFLFCAMAGAAAAQWLSIPLPGTPRTSDGKPNLNAAAAELYKHRLEYTGDGCTALPGGRGGVSYEITRKMNRTAT